MLISWHGHAEFYLESAEGFALLTDPYDAHVGYPMGEYPADAVTVSHGHGDHNFTEKVTGVPRKIDAPGEFLIAPDVKVTAIPCFHDEAQGALRGANLIMKIEMDGLTVAHLGDLGHMLTEEQLSALGQVDVLLIPVGGHYTIDGAAACRVVHAVQPHVVIPMHFKQPGIHDGWPITDEKPFLQGMGAAQTECLPLLRITKEDLSQQPPVALLSCQ
ncbi:MAG: MBL fold metallo-hydrolase [Clostridiales bacterium]|nr:MBL fold metallo-hydrolase [Clostridiales bacterium]